MNKESVIEKYIKKIQNSRFNRYYIYEMDLDSDEYETTLFLDGTGEYAYVCFKDDGVELGPWHYEISVLFKEATENRYYDEMYDRHTYYEETDSMPINDLVNLLYEFTIIGAGATSSFDVMGDVYRKYKNFVANEYEIFIENYYSYPYSKQFANLTFYINENNHEKKDNRLKLKIEYDFEKLAIWNDVDLKRIIDKLIGWDKFSKETNYYFHRYWRRENFGKLNFCDYYNDVQGDFFSRGIEEGLIVNCRDMAFVFPYESGIKFANEDIPNCMIYTGAVDTSAIVDFYKLVGEVRLILSGAGDISHEEKVDADGKVTGYNIYIEKEYDKSYTKELGNLTFYINNGYKHKTEQERLVDFFDKNKVELKDMRDVVKNILYPFQTTKASRFLCYKIIEDETITLHFNGKDGDYYLKATDNDLIFHCRDMAICFTEGAKAMAEEDDIIMTFKSNDEASSLKDIFTAAFDMIFILAGAGEVTYEKLADEGSYKISLEKEYVDSYSKTVGNITFDVRRER